MNKFALPVSDIPYGIKREVGEFTYSIDKFRPRFPLKWQRLQILCDGMHLPLTDENVMKGFVSSCVYPLYAVSHDVIDHGPSRNPMIVHWWKCDGMLILLEKFKPFGSSEYNYSAVIEFNPNKHMGSPVPVLFVDLVKKVCDGFFSWRNTRCDFTLDVPYPIRDIRLLSRKSASAFAGTYYFGQRGNPGYTRVYDKRVQMREVFCTEIGREVTRIEWEQHFSECSFDQPYRIGDLGTHEVLRYVPMNDWMAALRTYDPRTARKIKESCLYEIPFQPALFDDMLSELLDLLHLDPADCLDHVDRKRKDQAQEAADREDYEKMISWLRKVAQVED